MRISRESMLMQIANIVSERGTCSRAQVGAVIARENRIISTGYNGAPSGMKHCVHHRNDTEKCTRAVHAEMNAILFAAKHGLSVDGCDMYTTVSPCPQICIPAIINSGIKRVFYATFYPTVEPKMYEMLKWSEVEWLLIPNVELQK